MYFLEKISFIVELRSWNSSNYFFLNMLDAKQEFACEQMSLETRILFSEAQPRQ